MADATIIDGKAFAATLRERVAGEVAALKAEHGLTPGLAVVLVGEDPASQVYVRNKGEQTEAAGMYSETHRLPADTAEADLFALVDRLNADPNIHGILVQFPVPAHLSQDRIVARISPDKDVDGLTVLNAGRLASGLPALTACTPVGCMMLIRDALGGELRGKRAVVIGRSNLMGKPMAQLLLAADCTVTIAHSRTVDLPAVCREADILVAAVGRAEMVKGDWIKPGAVVIDVGITRLPSLDPEKAAQGKTRIVGDVDFKQALAAAGAVTPVPGGVGPMTIACLLQNTLTAAKRIHGLEG
ncbi:bifunctional methylenetetrahydrofolate dehydrogenase/methenyltetrahydrofolate cyclohydrolase FolD [Caulobacter mirabilis]|uniref:Bifunctional protein FolD n=1 Tax=Caulobacter mirabilis TaxID=69666 RepID=A0A2D2AWR2_9CAUL|nr:bifunctional methylenetetrahydrofolate dehydrogenase/methenyltetrahydrofolate cyclohydrolase FolD [Caulobacter mirabilis]ATQ42387.1 bifunctional methylenetetrahydrofolate dehydrogenase/methenyltetrahydrofolate cyclohydrolase FolD [Caulobacter mirabilis]